MVHPYISWTQATSDASALTLASNSFVRSCEPGLFSNGLSKEPGNGPDAQRERRSRLHRKPIFRPSWRVVRFVVVLHQREERLHFRHWRSCGCRGLPSGGDHNLCANCPVRLGCSHADRHHQRPLSGSLIGHDAFSLPVLTGTFPIRRLTRT